MKAKVTIKDVATAAGASVGLTSMIINGKAPAKCKKREAVLNAIKSLNYIPNRSAAELRQGIRKKIGVITPDLSNHYFSEISRHIENIAYENGYIVLFGSSDDSPAKFASVTETFLRDGVCGLIVTPCEGVEKALNNAIGFGVPVVLMNRDIEGVDGAGKVFLDNDKAIRMCIDFLRGKGYSHIAMISDDACISTQKSREESFIRHTRADGREGTLIRVPQAYESEPYVSAVQSLKSMGADAILVPKGHLALHVFKAVKGLGLKIPGDFAITGFDGGITYELVTPSISQVEQSTKETADVSFNMLCGMIEDPHDIHTVLLEPRIREGESS